MTSSSRLRARRLQHHPDGDRQHDRRQQAERERPQNDFGDLDDLIDVAADHQHVAVRQRMGGDTHVLQFATMIIDANDHLRWWETSGAKSAGRLS